MLLPASHVTYTVYNFTDLINNSVCLSVCLSDYQPLDKRFIVVDNLTSSVRAMWNPTLFAGQVSYVSIITDNFETRAVA